MNDSYTFYFEQNSNQRLDHFICEKIPDYTRAQIQKWIKEKHVQVNDQSTKSSYHLKEHDKVTIKIPQPQSLELQAENIPLDVLYEDSDLIVINKSAEQVVHPGAGHSSGTLVHALLAHCQDLSGIGGKLRPGIVHRLDKGTSGVIVIAKNDFSHQNLANQFKERLTQKIYQAFVWGELQNHEGTIEKALGRSSKNRKKISTESHKLREATTHYRVIKGWGAISFVELKPKTGRTHQLRVHMAELGHAILCDPLYGRNHSKILTLKKPLQDFLKSRPYQFLHAASLAFEHPRSQQKLFFSAPLRKEMQDLYDLLES